jgi:hypothetical protein
VRDNSTYELRKTYVFNIEWYDVHNSHCISSCRSKKCCTVLQSQ